MNGESPVRIDRRTTLKWLAATMAAAHASCGREEKFVGSEIPPQSAANPSGSGYGKDPDLMQPVVPWARTMSDAELAIAAALCDLILPEDEHSPAASALGVPDFIDEWISAPYPQQRADRDIVLPGLAWLDTESRARDGRGFADAPVSARTAIVDRLASAIAETEPQAAFFRRFRALSVGAYYTTGPGMRDIGYVGNVAIGGPYPGPSEAALAHLEAALRTLDLDWPA